MFRVSYHLCFYSNCCMRLKCTLLQQPLMWRTASPSSVTCDSVSVSGLQRGVRRRSMRWLVRRSRPLSRTGTGCPTHRQWSMRFSESQTRCHSAWYTPLPKTHGWWATISPRWSHKSSFTRRNGNGSTEQPLRPVVPLSANYYSPFDWESSSNFLLFHLPLSPSPHPSILSSLPVPVSGNHHHPQPFLSTVWGKPVEVSSWLQPLQLPKRWGGVCDTRGLHALLYW